MGSVSGEVLWGLPGEGHTEPEEQQNRNKRMRTRRVIIGLVAVAMLSVGTAQEVAAAETTPTAVEPGPVAARAIECETDTSGEDTFYDGPSASYLYDGLFEKTHSRVPAGELDERIPQGLTTWKNWDQAGHDLLLVGTYDKEGEQSRLVGIDPDSGKNVGTVAIDKTHAGGLAVVKNWLFVQDSGKQIRKYKLSDLRYALQHPGAELKKDGAASEVYAASFLSDYGDSLWAGGFNQHGRDKMYRYQVNDDGSLTEKQSWEVPIKMQGLLVTPEYFVYSTSFGRTNRSNIYVTDRDEHDLDKAALSCFRAPSMSEGLTEHEGDAYLVFESAASFYRGDEGERARNVIPDLHKAPLSGLVQLLDDSDIKRTSLSCSSPEGNYANYSWADGWISTTVYFNNHCSQAVDAELHFTGTEAQCMTTNGGTLGRDRYWETGLVAITKGC